MDMKDYFKSLEGFSEELKREGNPTRNSRQGASRDNGTRQRYATGGDVKHRSRFPSGGGVNLNPIPQSSAGEEESEKIRRLEETRRQKEAMYSNSRFYPTSSASSSSSSSLPFQSQAKRRKTSQGAVPSSLSLSSQPSSLPAVAAVAQAPALPALSPPPPPPLPQQLASALGDRYTTDNFSRSHMFPVPEGLGGKKMRSELKKSSINTAQSRGAVRSIPGSSKLAYDKAGETYLKTHLSLPQTQRALKRATKEEIESGTGALYQLPIPRDSSGQSHFKAATVHGPDITYYKPPFDMLVGAQQSLTNPGRYIMNHNEGFVGTKVRKKRLSKVVPISP